MKTAFVLFVSPTKSEEMNLCLELLRQSIPSSVDTFILENARILQPTVSDVTRLLPLQSYDYLFIALKTTFIITNCSINEMMNIIYEDIDLDCLIPASIEDVKHMGLTPYHTLRGFEVFSKQLRSVADRKADYNIEIPPLLYMIRSKSLANFSPALLIKDVIRHLPPYKVKLTYHAFIHSFDSYYFEDRRDVFELIPQGVNTILDIGCASAITWKLKEYAWHITGIEPNLELAKIASNHIERAIHSDILSVNLSETFDCVLCLDVLEHLYQTREALQKIKKWLKDEGTLIISTPNIGHWSIIEDLIAGRWDYTPAGILCITHKRYFTLHSISNALKTEGFDIKKIIPLTSPTPPYLTEFIKHCKALSLTVNEDSLSSLGYYIVCSKGSSK